MRITIIGLPGSGKTTLARSISKKLSIPHIQIDRFWFESGGRSRSRDTLNIEKVRECVKEKTLSAISSESWVSDGFYSRLQPDIAKRADKIIFLDIPIWQRHVNHATRILHPVEKHRELNTWDDLKFFYEIIRRTFINGPKLRTFLTEYNDKIIILKSREEIHHFLQNLDEGQ